MKISYKTLNLIITYFIFSNFIPINNYNNITFAQSVKNENENENENKNIESKLFSTLDFNTLNLLENEISIKQFDIENGIYSTSELYKRLSNIDNNGNELISYIKSWNELHKNFHNELDKFTIKQMNYFINDTYEYLKIILNDFAEQNKINLSENKKLSHLIEKMETKYNNYKNNLKNYGKAKDKDRMYPFRDFFRTATIISNIIIEKSNFRNYTQTNTKTEHSININPIFYLKKFYNYTSLANPGMKLIYHTFFPSSKVVPNNTPLVNSFEKFYKNLGKSHGVKVTVLGSENLPKEIRKGARPLENKINERKKVYILAGSHRDEEGDTYALPYLGIKDHMTFFAAFNVLPKGLAKRVDKSQDILVVGGDKNDRIYSSPLDKLKEKLKENLTNVIIIFPQGSTSILNEVHPPREKTVWDELGSEDIEFIIIPFTIDVDARFLSKSGSIDNKSIKMIIDKPVDQKMIDFLILNSGGDKQIINRYLRSLWIENIKNFKHLSNQEIKKRISEKITKFPSIIRNIADLKKPNESLEFCYDIFDN